MENGSRNARKHQRISIAGDSIPIHDQAPLAEVNAGADNSISPRVFEYLHSYPTTDAAVTRDMPGISADGPDLGLPIDGSSADMLDGINPVFPLLNPLESDTSGFENISASAPPLASVGSGLDMMAMPAVASGLDMKPTPASLISNQTAQPDRPAQKGRHLSGAYPSIAQPAQGNHTAIVKRETQPQQLVQQAGRGDRTQQWNSLSRYGGGDADGGQGSSSGDVFTPQGMDGSGPLAGAVGGGRLQVSSSTRAKEDERRLTERARQAHTDAKGKNKEIPPFVKKLEAYLSDLNNRNLIRWSEDGKSFVILDDEAFAKTLIPQRFKHNNYASFVRQLNMYGFHKRIGLEDGSLMSNELGAKTPHTYDHPYFQRDKPELQWLITKPRSTAATTSTKRKRTATEDDGIPSDDDDDRAEDTVTVSRSEWNMMKAQLAEYQSTAQQMQNNTQHFIKVLQELKDDSELEKSITRKRIHTLEGMSNKQAATLQNILTFITKLYANHASRNSGQAIAPGGYTQMISTHGGSSSVQSGQQGAYMGNGRLQSIGGRPMRGAGQIVRGNRRAVALLPAPESHSGSTQMALQESPRVSAETTGKASPAGMSTTPGSSSTAPTGTLDSIASSTAGTMESMESGTPEGGLLDNSSQGYFDSFSNFSDLNPDEQLSQMTNRLTEQQQKMKGLVDRMEPLTFGGMIPGLETTGNSGWERNNSFDWSQFLNDGAADGTDLFSNANASFAGPSGAGTIGGMPSGSSAAAGSLPGTISTPGIASMDFSGADAGDGAGGASANALSLSPSRTGMGPKEGTDSFLFPTVAEISQLLTDGMDGESAMPDLSFLDSKVGADAEPDERVREAGRPEGAKDESADSFPANSRDHV